MNVIYINIMNDNVIENNKNDNIVAKGRRFNNKYIITN